MQNLIFCNVAYMKRYQGITTDDKPNIDIANDSINETYNFLPNNHICYGFVNLNNLPINIELVKSSNSNASVIHDVTIIWTALDDNKRKIVGWYEHADVYRNCQIFADDTLGDIHHVNWKFYFETNEKSVYIVPENERNFDVSTLSMSNSNISYVGISEELVNKVFNYINSVRNSCIQPFISAETLNEKAAHSSLTNKELLEQACKLSDEGQNIEAIQIFNLLESQVDDEFDLNRIKFLHGWSLNRLMLYDEAIEIYRQVLNQFEQLDGKKINQDELALDCMWRLAWLYQRTIQYTSAWTLYEKLFNFEHELGDKLNALIHLMWIATEIKDWSRLQKVIDVYDSLNTHEMLLEVNEYRKILQRIK